MIQPSLDYEQLAWHQGHSVVVGVDEVGRGAWAGPVVAAAVQLPKGSVMYAQSQSGQSGPVLPRILRDSKKLSASQRVQLNGEIRLIATQIAIGQVEVDEINQLGIGPANFLAMSRALDQLQPAPDYLLIDGFLHPEIDISRQLSVIKGDGLVASIAAASVVAKVYRDQLMTDMAQTYPLYGLEKHKGYGTAVHQQAIVAYGLSPIHRRNFNLKFLKNEPGINLKTVV